MAEYVLSTWESSDLVELVSPVAMLLESLPFPPSRGSFSTGVNEWEVVRQLSLLPHRARYCCAFQGANLPLDAFLHPSIGNARAMGEAFDISVSPDLLRPMHGYAGEPETLAHVHVQEAVPSADWPTRMHDPQIVEVVKDCCTQLGHSDAAMNLHLSRSSPSTMWGGRALYSYIIRVPIGVAADAFRHLTHRLVPRPLQSEWEVIGSFADVERARLSSPPGATSMRVGDTFLGGIPPVDPWFALERSAWMRPVANFNVASFHNLATGLAALSDQLIRPTLYFGPLIWPSRELAPLAIYYNHVIVRYRKGAWRVIVGIWKENDDDPEVREVRKFVEPLVNAIRPSKFLSDN